MFSYIYQLSLVHVETPHGLCKICWCSFCINTRLISVSFYPSLNVIFLFFFIISHVFDSISHRSSFPITPMQPTQSPFSDHHNLYILPFIPQHSRTLSFPSHLLQTTHIIHSLSQFFTNLSRPFHSDDLYTHPNTLPNV